MTASLVCAVVGVAGLLAWSGYQLRAAERASREFRRADAASHLEAAFPFRAWWDSDSRFLAARLARVSFRLEEAAEHLTACQKLEGPTPRVQLEWVLLRAIRGGFEEVEPGLWNCVQNEDPDSPFILEVIVGMHLQSLQFPLAATALDRWVALDPRNPVAWELRGWVLSRLDLEDEAEKSLTRCLELDPGRDTARSILAELYLKRFKVDQAGALIDRLVAEHPDRPATISAAGQYQFLRGQTDSARQLFDRAYGIDPHDQDLIIRRAKLELQSGSPVEAEIWLRRALQIEEANSEVHFLLLQAITAQPGREKDVAAQLATYEKYKSQAERFSRLLREIVPANPHDPRYAAELGDVLFQTGQDAKGAFWHLRALKIDPEYAPSHRALAGYYERAGQSQDASFHRGRLTRTEPVRGSKAP